MEILLSDEVSLTEQTANLNFWSLGFRKTPLQYLENNNLGDLGLKIY